jgi:hypothetical protein
LSGPPGSSRWRDRRKHCCDELTEEGVALNENGEVAAFRYRDERLARRADGLDERSRETRWRGEILVALDDEHGHSEIATECVRAERTPLRNQPLGTQVLPVEPVVDVAQRVAGSRQCEADHRCDEEIGAFEQIRPPALDG